MTVFGQPHSFGQINIILSYLISILEPYSDALNLLNPVSCQCKSMTFTYSPSSYAGKNVKVPHQSVTPYLGYFE